MEGRFLFIVNSGEHRQAKIIQYPGGGQLLLHNPMHPLSHHHQAVDIELCVDEGVQCITNCNLQCTNHHHHQQNNHHGQHHHQAVDIELCMDEGAECSNKEDAPFGHTACRQEQTLRLN